MATFAEVSDRQVAIATLTHSYGRCSVSDLSTQFDVTPETIRRDLRALEARGLVQRVHGGAVSLQSLAHPERLAYEDDGLPVHQSQRRKQSIAQAALAEIPSPESSIFIDAGSTTEAFSHVLANSFLGQNWSIVTTSPNVAVTLAAAGVPNVNVIGGVVKARTQAIVGDQAVQEMDQLRADVAFIGTSGLSVHGGFTTSDPKEADIKAKMIQSSLKSVALCDSAKIGVDSIVRFAELESVNVVVTDRFAPQSFRDAMKNSTTSLVIP